MTTWWRRLPISRTRDLVHSNAIWGFADQGVISASNFAVTLILARALGPDEFGLFVLAYLALMFINSAQGTLFAQPHNVLGATMGRQAYARYTTSTLMVLALFAAFLATILVTSAVVAAQFGSTGAARLLLSLTPVAFFMQIQDFIRRTAYTRSKYKLAFWMSFLAYGGHAAMVVVFWRTGHLSVSVALLSMALAFVTSLLVGLYAMRSRFFWRPSREAIRQATTENWRFGRWLFGGSLAYWLSSQMLPILVAGIVGPAATAGLRTAQNFVAPTHIVLRALETMAPSRASMEFQQNGYEGLQRYMVRIATPGMLILMVFFVPVAVFAQPITGLLVGDQYVPYAWLVPIFVAAYFMEYLASVASIMLKVLHDAQAIMIAQGTSAALTLSLGVLIVWRFGLGGAAIGMIAHVVITNCILWSRVLSRRSDSQQSIPELKRVT